MPGYCLKFGGRAGADGGCGARAAGHHAVRLRDIRERRPTTSDRAASVAVTGAPRRAAAAWSRPTADVTPCTHGEENGRYTAAVKRPFAASK